MVPAVRYLVLAVGAVCFWLGTDGATVPPANVRVFALTFMDLDLTEDDRSYTQILISTVNSSRLRVKVPFASESKYSNIRWSVGRTYFNFTDDKVDQTRQRVVLANKSTIVVAKDTVNIYGSHTMAGSSEAYLALPITRRSHSFYLASYPTIRNVGSAFYGLAAAAETCVDVFRRRNGSYERLRRIQMRAGDVYHEYGDVAGDDFTGLRVQSTQGVSVFSGHECAQIPVGVQFCDVLLEQMPPTHEWGAETVVPAMPGRSPAAGYTIRIVAAERTTVQCSYAGTDVTLSAEHGCGCLDGADEPIEFRSCTRPCLVDPGSFVELTVADSRRPVKIDCRPSCLVVQYGRGRQVALVERDDPDPSMIVITPTDHYGARMTYVTPDYVNPATGTLSRYVNYLAIVVPIGQEKGLRLDDKQLADDTSTVTVADKYTVVTVDDVTYGQHKIEHVTSDVMIGAFAYGNTPRPSGVMSPVRSSYSFPVFYRIDGETVKGDWLDELVVKPGDDVITYAPKYCQHTEVNSVHDTFTLSTNKTFPSCTAAVMTASKLDRLRSDVNQAICEGLLCRGVSNNVFISHLRFSDLNKINGLDIRLVTTMDTPMTLLLQCKKDVISYMTYADHWTNVLTEQELASCRQLIHELKYTKTVYSCPSAGA